MVNAEYAFETLKEEYEISDDNVAEFRWALSFEHEYAEYVQLQAQIVVESINMGQSVLSLGELMRPLFCATHKFVAGDERELPGVEFFEMAAKVSFEALEYITTIAAVTEEWATTQLSCFETVDVSYI